MGKSVILNSADQTRHYAVVRGEGLFKHTDREVQDVVTYPIGSQYINTEARSFMIRVSKSKSVADWVKLGGGGTINVIDDASDLSTPTAEKWGADAILTGLKELAVKIPVPTSTWDKIHIKQVNDALALAFPEGIPEILSGNVKEQDYAYSAIESDISDNKLNLDVLTITDSVIHIEAQCYNGTTKVGDAVMIDIALEY